MYNYQLSILIKQSGEVDQTPSSPSVLFKQYFLTLLLYLILTFNKTNQTGYLKPDHRSTVFSGEVVQDNPPPLSNPDIQEDKPDRVSQTRSSINRLFRRSSSRHLTVLLSSLKSTRFLTLLLYLILTFKKTNQFFKMLLMDSQVSTQHFRNVKGCHNTGALQVFCRNFGTSSLSN